MEGERVIVASPCDAERRLLGHLLLRDGLEVVEVASGNEVIEEAQKGDPSLIILDTLSWHTPALNTLRALKSNERMRETPVMLFGQPASREEVVAAVKTGAATWIGRKGFQIELFIEKVRELVLNGTRISEQKTATIRMPRPGIQLLSPEHLQEVLTGIKDLAVFDFAINEAITSTCAKERLVDHITHIVGRDPMLAIALLTRAAGQGHQELADGSCSLRETVEFLGDRSFHKIAESLSSLTIDEDSDWDAGHFWLHSVAVSRLAGLFSQTLGIGRPAEAMNAGLFHDIGYYVLAQLFPAHFAMLLKAAASSDCVTAETETELIGMHHGAIGAATLKHFGLSEGMQAVAFAHELDAGACQSLRSTSRILTMIVQAADQMATAMFPGDPPLVPLVPLTPDFEAALESAGVLPGELVSKSHALVADLVAEMRWLFPKSETCPHHYLEPPIKDAIYFSPGKRPIDTVKLFFDARCKGLRALKNKKEASGLKDVPLVVNLMYVADDSVQVEVITALMAMGLLNDRRSIVLLDDLPKESFGELLPETCRLVTGRSQPARWLKWLAGRDKAVEQSGQTLSVA